MLLLVHGRHGNEDVPWIFARNIPDHWIIIAPRAIEFEPESDEHEFGYSWMEMPEDYWPGIGEFDGAVQALSDFVNALPDAYNADPEKVIALGFSQGAATALATAVEYPSLFKGIASLVGFFPTLPSEDDKSFNPLPLQDLPIFFAVGERDERIPMEISQQSMRELAGTGAHAQMQFYETGHKMNGQGMRDLGEWMQKLINKLDGVEG